MFKQVFQSLSIMVAPGTVAPPLLLLFVIFMALDTLFSLPDMISSGPTPSKARERVKAGLGLGGGEEEDESEEFWDEETEIIEDFTQIEDDLAGIESAEYDLESEFQAYKEYISSVNALRKDIAHAIQKTSFDTLEQKDRFVKGVIKPAVESIEDLHEQYEDTNPVHTVYDALLDAVDERVSDADDAASDLRNEFQDEIDTLQEAIEDVKEDEANLDTDSLGETDREKITRTEALKIINTNEKEISQLHTTDQKLDLIEEDIDEVESLNEQIKQYKGNLDDYISNVKRELGKYSTALRNAKKGGEEEKEAFDETLSEIIASFYGENPSRIDQAASWVKSIVTDVESNKPPLLREWDKMLTLFDDLQAEHQDLVERVETVEDELRRAEQEHHKA